MSDSQEKLGVMYRINKTVSDIVSLSIPILALLILYEIICRYIFNRPTIWVHDISQFVFGAGYMLGAGYALATDAHANMDILYNRLSIRKKAKLDVLTGILFLIYAIILTWYAGEMAYESIKYKEVLTQSPFEPPIYPMKIILFVGCLLLTFQGVSKFTRDLMVACTGKKDGQDITV